MMNAKLDVNCLKQIEITAHDLIIHILDKQLPVDAE